VQQFTNLIFSLENTSSSTQKITFLKAFFDVAPKEDKLWAIALFSHKRPKRQVNTRLLKQWACELSEIPEWLFEESYGVVGDLAETIALVLPASAKTSELPLSYWMDFLASLADKEEDFRKERVFGAWRELNQKDRFVFNKLITGGFRVGVSKNIMIKALSQSFEMESAQIAHLIMGDWTPNTITLNELLNPERISTDISKPYPFYLAYPLEEETTSLGSPNDWSAEWKWDGIRCQLIKRNDQVFLWSRGEELITDKFPEIIELGQKLPNGVALDGELIPYKDHPLPFSLLQTRIGRKAVTKKLLSEAPVIILAYDLMEIDGDNSRDLPFKERRQKLQNMIAQIQSPQLRFSQPLQFSNWSDLKIIREQSRAHYAEGLMLKSTNSSYKIGRKKGDWWKWKVEPYSIDAVMVYAQMGHGRRAGLYSDFTFAVWKGTELVTFAKAYTGLTDKELLEITKFVKANTKEKFGPVRTITPTLVFEIHFEGIDLSKRHKAGVAVRFPRIHRWRKDKKAEDANSISDLQSLLQIPNERDEDLLTRKS
jgi:DNA ligase-1